MSFPRRPYRQFSLWPTAILALALLCWYLGLARRGLPWRAAHALQRSTLAAARALQGSACQRDQEALRAHAAAQHAPACALDRLPSAPGAAGHASGGGGGGGGGGGARALGPPLHIFLRVSAQERSWSGAGRFLGWGKAETALATAYSLRVALDLLDGALAPPRAVNVTILYDGLQEDRPRQKAWAAAMGAVFLAGRRSGSGAQQLTVHHAPVAAADAGNRGTNLQQFRLAREVACAPPREPPHAAAEPLQGQHEQEGSEGGGGGGGGGGAGDPLVYFVEDDYIHAPSALAELVDVLTLASLDGAPPPAFATLTDYPDRLTFGGADVGAGAVTVTGSTRRHWRTLPSTTMTFAARCSEVLRALPVMQAAAPHDQDMWHSLLWWRAGGALLAQRSERLVGPMPSLAIHATDTYYSFYAPPLEVWGGGGSGALALTSWCGLATCLRDSAVQLLAAHAPAALPLMLVAGGEAAAREALLREAEKGKAGREPLYPGKQQRALSSG